MTPDQIAEQLKADMEAAGWAVASEEKSHLSESRYLKLAGQISPLSPRGRAVWLRKTGAARPFEPGYPVLVRVSDHKNSSSHPTPHFSIFQAEQIERVRGAIALWNALATYYAPGQTPRADVPAEYAFVR